MYGPNHPYRSLIWRDSTIAVKIKNLLPVFDSLVCPESVYKYYLITQ